MKRTAIFLTLIFSLFLTPGANAFGALQSRNLTVEGRVLDENGSPTGYATVVLLTSGMEQAAGAVSDDRGQFRLSALPGQYTLKVIFMGYEDVTREIELVGNLDIGDIVLEPVMAEVEAVKVTGRAIVREADRFVVTVANTPGAIGKDAFEMLKTSPGVWINGSDITVNGRSGTRVMINDRLLRMTGEDLEVYLRSIKAEDILRIEIIPDAGADYDADSSGGIIKITLAKKRNDGLDGNITLAGGANYQGMRRVAPSFGLNYQSGKLNLYGNVNYNYSEGVTRMDETTTVTDPVSGIVSRVVTEALMTGSNNGYGGRLGGVYDFNAKNSIGAEFSLHSGDYSGDTDSKSLITTEGITLGEGGSASVNEAMYSNTVRLSDYYTGTMNYIRKLDEKGSTFKLIGDWAGNFGDEQNNNTIGYPGTALPDSLGRIDSDSKFNIYSVNAAFDFVRNPTTVIKAGAKFTHNTVYSDIMAEGSVGGSPWALSEWQSSVTDYAENIGALYAIYNGRIGKVGLSAGLRGEYTFMRSRYSQTYDDPSPTTQNKDYFDVFPNLNVSVPLNAAYSNTLVFSYSRSISRPNFSTLSPFRNQLSNNSYISGNPDLKPMYANNISVTGVFAYKYSLTLGASIMQDQIMQQVIEDEQDPNVLIYKFMNTDSNVQFYASLNAPVTIMEGWTANINLTAMQMNQKLEENDPFRSRFTVFGNLSTNISIPKWFDIEVSYFYMSKYLNANMEQMPSHYLGAGLKRRFADNKFTLSLNVNGLIHMRQDVHSFGENFDKWAYVDNGNHLSVTLSLRYNFTAGVKFRARTVEKGAGDDLKRLGGGGE